MHALAGPLAIAAVVLAIGGAEKLRDPAPTATAIGSLGLAPSRALARLTGVVEVAVGAATVLLGGRVLAAAVAILYAGFAAVAQRLRTVDGASCGCFGQRSAPASVTHVVTNLVVGAVAATAAIASAPGLLDLWHELPFAGLPYLALVALGSWLLVALLTVLPDTLHAARRTPVSETPVRTFTITGTDA